MTPTLVPHHPARDWAEIQERMLVPLYEAVYERLGVGAGSRVLGLGCGSGLALLMAAARGARVAGADRDHARVELARERLPEDVAVTEEPPAGGPYDVVTAFHATDGLLAELTALTRSAQRGATVVLAAVVESVDDSDGRLGEIGADLADAHHEACRATVPDLVELAYWLVTRALDDAADLTDIDPLDCEELLRRAGDGRPAPVRGRGMADEPHRLGREVLDAAPCEVWTGH
jgi:SAM-dependent methyltransferase